MVVIAGYLVWLRSKVEAPVTPSVEEEIQATPTLEPEVSATPSATPATKEATGSMKQKTGTAPAVTR